MLATVAHTFHHFHDGCPKGIIFFTLWWDSLSSRPFNYWQEAQIESFINTLALSGEAHAQTVCHQSGAHSGLFCGQGEGFISDIISKAERQTAERERESAFICWFSSQILATAGAGPDWSREAETKSESSMWVAEIQVLKPWLLPLLVCIKWEPQTGSMGCRHPQWCLNSWIKCTLLNGDFRNSWGLFLLSTFSKVKKYLAMIILITSFLLRRNRSNQK